MKLDKRLSSYPILVNGDDDYIDSSFDFHLSQETNFDKIIIHGEFILRNAGLKELIKQGKAAYIMHVECTSLSLRKTYTSKDETIECSIDLQDLSENIEVSSAVIATEDIEKYVNENFNKLYGNEGVNIDKGNYLAIGPSYTIDIDRSNVGYKKLSDIIVIQKSDNSDEKINIDLSSDVIRILVNEDIKNKYYSYGKQYLYNIISMIMVPSMIYVLTSMKNNEDSLKDYKWFSVIEKLLKDNDIEISDLSDEDSAGKNSIFEIAQKIFKMPLEKGFDDLLRNGGNE